MVKRFAIWKLFGQVSTKQSQDELCCHLFCPTFSWVKMSLMSYKASLGSTDAQGSCCGSGLPSQHIHCFTSSWLMSEWTASGWKHGTTKSRFGMFLPLILLGQWEHWRSIWPEAVFQPDHRHKLTTCVLVHKADELPRLGDSEIPSPGFVLANTNEKCSCDPILSLTLIHWNYICPSLDWVQLSMAGFES